MFDVVAPDQYELPLAVEIVSVDDAEPGLALAPPGLAAQAQPAALDRRTKSPSRARSTRMTTEATITFCAVESSNPNKLCKVCLIFDDGLGRPKFRTRFNTLAIA